MHPHQLSTLVRIKSDDLARRTAEHAYTLPQVVERPRPAERAFDATLW